MEMNHEFFMMRMSYSNYASMYEDENEYETYTCEVCESNIHKRLTPFMCYFKGKKMADFYKMSEYSVISKTMQEVLSENKIKGFELRNIVVEGWYDNNDEPIDIDYSDLKELVIMGKSGFLCDKNGEIVEKCNTCNVFDYDKAGDMLGFSVKIEVWDGSDMFFFDNWPGVIIVTEKVKNLIEEKKLKNITFTNLKEYTFF